MKIALITDTHFGARGDSIVYANYFKKFYDEIFFPYIDEHDISTVIHLGDIVDRRKYINYLTADNLYETLIKPCKIRGIDLNVIIGNHDTYYKNTNKYNAMRQLYQYCDLVDWYEEATEVDFGSCKMLFVPWINSGNIDHTMEMLSKSKAQVVMGHLELKGFQMYKGAINDHGFDTDPFDKFDMVMSGHFHHKSSSKNIHYLGSPYEITWSDYNDERGFHVFDTETRELTYVRNTFHMFNKLYYDDSLESHPDLLKTDLSHIRDSNVKVIIKNKDNPYFFDLYLDYVNSFEPHHIQTVEDNLNLQLEGEDHIVDEAEDTLTVLNKFIESLEIKEKKELKTLFAGIYEEALDVVGEHG
jgi:3',5'-cyclic AMP phosphodiesterase CpdA